MRLSDNLHEDVQEVYYELKKIKDSKNRISHLITANPNLFSNEKLKEVVHEIISM